MIFTKILSVKNVTAITGFRLEINQSHLSREIKWVCPHEVSPWFFPPTPSAVPHFPLCDCGIHLWRVGIVFSCGTGNSQIPSWSFLAIFVPFMKYVVLARVKIKQCMGQRNAGTEPE